MAERDFEAALANAKNPPYPDPDVDPAPKTADSTFHDEDGFNDPSDRGYGGWDFPPYGRNYYFLVVHSLLKAGLAPAPPSIRRALYSLSNKYPELGYPDIIDALFSQHGKPPPNWLYIGSHERGGPVRRVIDDIAAKGLGRTHWLMPVAHYEEEVGISWDFYFVPKDEEAVLKQIMALSVMLKDEEDEWSKPEN